jgi:hydroxyacylglutathione hydrolase
MEEKPIQNKNNLALIAGLVLIVLVAMVTILRPTLTGKSQNDQKTAAPEANNLKNRAISSDDLSKKILIQTDLAIIDIRSETNFKKEHIMNSENIPAERLESALSALDKEKTYIIIADSFSTQDVTFMENIFQKNDIKSFFYLAGGFPAWKSRYNPTVSEGDPTSFVDQSKVTYIKTDELKKLMETDNNLFIIDLRKSGQFSQGHIKNAVNIFLDDLEQEKGKIMPGKKIILCDNDGLWALKGAVRLYDLGIFNVFALSDGLDAWKKKGFEVVK